MRKSGVTPPTRKVDRRSPGEPDEGWMRPSREPANHKLGTYSNGDRKDQSLREKPRLTNTAGKQTGKKKDHSRKEGTERGGGAVELPLLAVRINGRMLRAFLDTGR